MTENDVVSRLYSVQDAAYRDFQAPLVPTVPKERIIGVRFPELRKLAKALAADPTAALFLERLPHRFYDEDLLHALMLNGEKDLDLLVSRLEAFLPFVDNWAVCDTLRPKAFARHKDEAFALSEKWIASPHEYTVRFGLGMFMAHQLESERAEEALLLAEKVSRPEYYVQMMQAWLFATALAKCPETALRVIERGGLQKEVVAMTARKCFDSRRVEGPVKERIKAFKLSL